MEPAPSGPRGDARGAREPAAGLKATSVRGAHAGGGVLRVPGAPFPIASMDGGAALAPPPQARRPPPHPGLGGGVPMHVDVDAPLGSSNAGSSCRCSCRPGSSDATDCSCPCHGFPAAGIGGGGGAPMDQSANSSGGGGLFVASTSAGGGAVGRRSTAAAAAQAAARAAVQLGRLAADSKRAEDAASARQRLEALAASSVRPGTNISSGAPSGDAHGGVLRAKRFRGSSAPSSGAPPPVRAPILTGSGAPSLDSSMVNPQQGASPPSPAAASGGPPLAGFKRAGRGPPRASATKKQQGVEDPGGAVTRVATGEASVLHQDKRSSSSSALNVSAISADASGVGVELSGSGGGGWGCRASPFIYIYLFAVLNLFLSNNRFPLTPVQTTPAKRWRT